MDENLRLELIFLVHRYLELEIDERLAEQAFVLLDHLKASSLEENSQNSNKLHLLN
jgi:hypothetical protein